MPIPLLIGSENIRCQCALLSDLVTLLKPIYLVRDGCSGMGNKFQTINVVIEYCRSNLALREAASSPWVISVVNSLTLMFMLPVPVQPGSDGAPKNGPQL